MMSNLFRYRRIIFIFLSVFFLLGFYIFSLGVKQERFTKLNFDTTVRVQDKLPKKLESYWEDLAFLVSPTVSVLLVLAITGIGFYDLKKKKIVPLVLVIPLAFGIMVGAEIIGKNRVESPAPPFMFLKNPTTHFPKYHVQDGYSYPSGHAARSLFLSSILLLIISKQLGIVEVLRHKLLSKKLIMILLIASSLFILTLGIALGKVYLGHHWITDIIGGWIIASAFISLAVSLL